MWENKLIYTHYLQPGMKLGKDLRDKNTGAVLLAKGTTVNQKKINAINMFAPEGKCYIMVEVDDPVPETPETSAADSHEADTNKTKTASDAARQKTDIDKDINAFPERISVHSQTIYKDTLKTVKSFYENPNSITAETINTTKSIAGRIADEVTRDPQILMQISMLKAFDNYTFSHAVHVAVYASTLANFLKMPQDKIQELCLAALLHDIGKVDVPDEILNKPGSLTQEEFAIIKEHPRNGYKRVYKFSNVTKDILQAIYQHHEKMDGNGYPQRLTGEQIHPWARIISVADVYDAVTTDRVYRDSLLPHVGAEILMSCAGQLDHNYIYTFLNNMPIYPVGSKVKLSTGEMGVVSRIIPNMPLRPVIKVIDGQGREVRTLLLNKELTVFITELLKD